MPAEQPHAWEEPKAAHHEKLSRSERKQSGRYKYPGRYKHRDAMESRWYQLYESLFQRSYEDLESAFEADERALRMAAREQAGLLNQVIRYGYEPSEEVIKATAEKVLELLGEAGT